MATSLRHTFKEILEKGISIDNHFINVDKIFIPRIQRSYAQGRKSEGEVRSNFLKDIFECLCDNSENTVLEMSFLFGSKQPLTNGGDGFLVLDGQQRITTLFLLHWYLWMKEKSPQTPQKESIPDFLKKFTYETRDTSTQFINKIVEDVFPLADIQPSKIIKASKWFTAIFNCDATVCSMLNMLDAIDERYAECCMTGLYDKLKRLQFYVLYLDDFELNDELYIKMNSRGLDLTPFENFKASLIRFMKKEGGDFVKDVDCNEVRMPYYLRFSTRMDSTWNDIFWALPQVPVDAKTNVNGTIPINNIEKDAKFFRFIIRYLFTKLVLVYGEKTEGYKELEIFLYQKNTKEDEPKTAESDYAIKVRMVGWDHFQKLLTNLGSKEINNLEKVLEAFRKYGNEINDLINGNPYADSSLSGKSLSFDGEYKEFTLPNRVIFATVTEFIETIPDGTDFMDETIQSNLNKLLRVMWNVLANTKTEDLTPTIRVIKAMSELIHLPGAVDGDFYQSISNNSISSKNAQLDEEISKAKKITDTHNEDSAWEESFKNAEKHPLFKGMVRFFYDNNISSSTDFDARYNVMKELFDKDGITEQYRVNHVLLRAMIGKMTFWDGNDGLRGKYITENAEKEGYLKILLGTEWAHSLFCGLFSSDHTDPLQYFNDIIAEARWGEPSNIEKNRVFNRLVNDGTRTVALFDKMSEFEKKRKKCFHIVENAKTIMACIPYNERIVLNTERHLIFKDLTSKDGFSFKSKSQEMDLSSPYEDVWGDNVTLQKIIKDSKGNEVVLSVVFELMKHVYFFITAKDTDVTPIDNLVEHEAGRWRFLNKVNYDSYSDYQVIKTEIDNIESIIQGL